ncbi:MAG: hypothetical protein KDA24_28585 [Deltaproteobacteria bacterium]|nr:hypothetical protein [Deltaproteobacteria bacterium]
MDTFDQAISEHLRAAALALPETSGGTSCVNRAFKVRKKNFMAPKTLLRALDAS